MFFLIFGGVTSTSDSLLSLLSLRTVILAIDTLFATGEGLGCDFSHKPPLHGSHVDPCNHHLGMLHGHFIHLQVKMWRDLLVVRVTSSRSHGNGANCSCGHAMLIPLLVGIGRQGPEFLIGDTNPEFLVGNTILLRVVVIDRGLLGSR